MSDGPLMPKATAVWLVDKTTLTFKQIADFTGLHPLEVEAIADGDVAKNIVGRDPVSNGELTAEEIAAAEGNPEHVLKLAKSDVPKPQKRTKGPRYTPVAKRGDKPDAIAWLLKNHPELSDAQIVRLIGTTKNTITAIRERTHANISAITPRNPVQLGLCTFPDLKKAKEKAEKALEREQKKKQKAKKAKKAKNLKNKETETAEVITDPKQAEEEIAAKPAPTAEEAAEKPEPEAL